MNIRDVIGRINFIGGQQAIMKEARRLLVGTAAVGRKGGGQLADRIKGMMAIEAQMNSELEAWAEPEDLQDGSRFDVCDLRIWLQLAAEAGVPHVPGKVILSVGEAGLEALLRPIQIPEDVSARVARQMDKAIAGDAELARIRETSEPEEAIDPSLVREIREAMTSSMEEIPPSWMVRTHLCGSSNLKALVGTGLMLKGDDVAEVAEGVKLGAGWVQVGNRQMIDFQDHRFIELAARGHKPVTHYIARPWEQPARFHEGEDIHRANSPLAGPGKWPAEWRVFIRNGQVTGVANYYGWTGAGATPENAWNALEAAALGQKLADHAAGRGLVGVFMDQQFLRTRAGHDPEVASALAPWAEDQLQATIDFIETAEGLKLLEGGPPHAPGGGAHPCAFAGQGVVRGDVTRMVALCEGAAFLPMEHAHLGEPKTWVDGDAAGRILDWPAVIELAVRHAPPSAEAEAWTSKIMNTEPAMEP